MAFPGGAFTCLDEASSHSGDNGEHRSIMKHISLGCSARIFVRNAFRMEERSIYIMYWFHGFYAVH